MDWDNDLRRFISLAWEYDVKMLMVGGGAVNFHGYQRHSADVDFWIDIQPSNLDKLKLVLLKLGYEFDSFPSEVQNGEQNISIKFSPDAALELELITRFNVNKSFEEAYNKSLIAQKAELNWRVINLEDLITSKVKSGRPKDELDIQELSRINSL